MTQVTQIRARSKEKKHTKQLGLSELSINAIKL